MTTKATTNATTKATTKASAAKSEKAFAPELVAPGLWRWSTPHPGWKPENDKPGGWARDVASAAIEGEGAGPLVLVDPLAPAGPAFWTWLAERRAARGGLAVLLGNTYHGRSAPEILERWPDTQIWGDPATRGRASVAITHEIPPATRGDVALPGGVIARAVLGLDDGELAFLVPAARALILTDAVTGIGGGKVRAAPRSWGKDPASYDRLFRASLRALLEVRFEHLLVSHGPSVLTGGHAALAEACDAEEWGAEGRAAP